MPDEVIIKRELSGKWHWLLRAADSHILNRSDVGFEDKQDCVADANRHGFEIGAVVE